GGGGSRKYHILCSTREISPPKSFHPGRATVVRPLKATWVPFRPSTKEQPMTATLAPPRPAGHNTPALAPAPRPEPDQAGVRPAPANRWATLAVLCLSLLVIVVDTTIVNVALPTLARQLHATTSGLQWIVDGYTLAFASLLLLAGALADRFGRHRALAAGLA